MFLCAVFRKQLNDLLITWQTRPENAATVKIVIEGVCAVQTGIVLHAHTAVRIQTQNIGFRLRQCAVNTNPLQNHVYHLFLSIHYSRFRLTFAFAYVTNSQTALLSLKRTRILTLAD